MSFENPGLFKNPGFWGFPGLLLGIRVSYCYQKTRTPRKTRIPSLSNKKKLAENRVRNDYFLNTLLRAKFYFVHRLPLYTYERGGQPKNSCESKVF